MELLLWKVDVENNTSSSPILHPHLAFVSELMPYALECPFGQSGAAGLAVPSLCPSMAGNVERQELCQPCPAAAKAGVLSAPSSSQGKAQH